MKPTITNIQGGSQPTAGIMRKSTFDESAREQLIIEDLADPLELELLHISLSSDQSKNDTVKVLKQLNIKKKCILDLREAAYQNTQSFTLRDLIEIFLNGFMCNN